MQTPEEFLESNGLATASLDRASLIAAFLKEMEAKFVTPAARTSAPAR